MAKAKQNLLLALGLWALAGRGPLPAEAPVRILDLDNIKMQWFTNDEDELPAWISAHLEVGPSGQVLGRVTEVELSDDGTDEDGDPYGFETSVFDTADGSLRDVRLAEDAFSFVVRYAGHDTVLVTYAGHRDPQGAWSVSAASRGKQGDSAGHNRFPLASERQGSTLTLYTQGEDPADGASQSL